MHFACVWVGYRIVSPPTVWPELVLLTFPGLFSAGEYRSLAVVLRRAGGGNKEPGNEAGWWSYLGG